jgi:AcrR family transcriptional regulator
MKGVSMKKQQGDRRVTRTHQMLRDALFALIEEQGYDMLSIQDITERANIGRATFYAHYSDKEQLLLASVKELLADMHQHMPLLSTADVLEKQQSLSVFVFRHVMEHAHIYRALLNERGASIVLVRLRADTGKSIEALISSVLAEARFTLPLDLVADYCAASLWALVQWWLKNDFPLSVEEMGQLYWKLINQGLIQTLGVRPPFQQ